MCRFVYRVVVIFVVSEFKIGFYRLMSSLCSRILNGLLLMFNIILLHPTQMCKFLSPKHEVRLPQIIFGFLTDNRHLASPCLEVTLSHTLVAVLIRAHSMIVLFDLIFNDWVQPRRLLVLVAKGLLSCALHGNWVGAHYDAALLTTMSVHLHLRLVVGALED